MRRTAFFLFSLEIAFYRTRGADPGHFTGFRYPGRPSWQFGLKSPYNDGLFNDSTPTRFTVPDISEEDEEEAAAVEDSFRRNYRPPRFIIPEVFYSVYAPAMPFHSLLETS